MIFGRNIQKSLQGAPESNPYEKFDISGTVVIFFSKLIMLQRRIQTIFIILQISLQYLLAFQNYNYLNLNVHFSK